MAEGSDGGGETGYFVDPNYTNTFLFNFSFCKNTADDIAWGQAEFNAVDKVTHLKAGKLM